MIDLYFGNSGNSLRALIILEEAGLKFRKHKLDLSNGDQRSTEFLQINPFGVVPAMYDSEGPGERGLLLNQSAAIMQYIAERVGRFVPDDTALRWEMTQWFIMAVSDAGPANALITYMNAGVEDLSEKGRAFLIERFLRLMRPVEAHLGSSRKYLCGEASLADFALFPAIRIRRNLLAKEGEFPNLLQWADRVEARPAVQAAIAA